jgi:ELWxxDGT repeat protein
VDVDGVLYFTAATDANGDELWRTDGTPQATRLVNDFTAGPGGSAPEVVAELNGRIFVVATMPDVDREVWVGDLDSLPKSPGDFNRSGHVDGSDFLLWQRTASTAASPPRIGADANGDGQVDAADQAVWQAAFTARPKRDAAVATFRPGSRLDYLGLAAAQNLSIPRQPYRPTAQAADAALLAENVARPAYRPQLHDAVFADLPFANPIAALIYRIPGKPQRQRDLNAVDNLLADWHGMDGTHSRRDDQ